MKVIIHNDDFGLNYGFTKAIEKCHLDGLTTSTAIRVNGTAYDYTVKNILPKLPNIGIGLHLNITEGPATTPYLANNKGNYKRNFLGYLIELLVCKKKILEKIKLDLEAQYKKAIEIDKIKIDHVSGHDHVHMIPPIFEIVSKLNKKYKIKYIRLVREDYYLANNTLSTVSPFFNSNIIKFLLLNYCARINQVTIKKYKLKTTDRFYGVLYTGSMGPEIIMAALKHAQSNNCRLIEILSHPAIKAREDRKYTSKFIKSYTNKKNRKIEYEALLSNKLKLFVKKNKISLTYYGKLK